jgi:hypothetical protein
MIEHDNVLCRPQTNSSSLSLQQAMQRWSARPTKTEPAAADAAADSDPIYAAIEVCRKALRSFEWNCDKADRLDQASDAHADSLAEALQVSYRKFAETVPTTIAGLFAQIQFEHEMRQSFVSSMFVEVEIVPTLAIAAARLATKPAA